MIKVLVIDVYSLEDKTIDDMNVEQLKQISNKHSLKDFEYLYNKGFIDTINTYIKFMED